MILNGKAKDDFKKWFIETKDLYDSYENELRLMSDTGLNALIIEFFDEQNIYIDIRIEFNDSFDSYADDYYVGNYSNRQEATIQAIIKANKIYNVLYSKQKQVK